ncbi:CoB--CoM heterodisulfide reductase iron-sulfur subunit A family protein, partial [candidate division WOR-3 bacterium]|nr:CoB--CoM heterodisulfide reductase iron-sulfur subunit A family protein [candidate division WOR-3 bacterium]
MPVIAAQERVKSFVEFELGFTEEQAIAEATRCLECGLCSECLECERVCEADAVIHSMLGEYVDINVGAVILATGAKKFDPSVKYEFGYGKFSNVLTSMEFERVLSASGPFAGHIQRLSDGKVPKRIAWIQCVGSRDELERRKYCSSVCCMYAIKEAVIAKEHFKEIEPTIFYMDIRAYGKDFDVYYNRAKDEYGVRFVRSRVGKVVEIGDTGNLMVYYTTEDSDRQLAEEFDMVVLSIGFESNKVTADLADILGIRLNKHKFFKTSSLSPVQTTRQGIFVCGPASSPKDIPETVMQASGAVAAVEGLLAEARGTEIVPKIYPPERDVYSEPPRIGVFVCHCGINIGSVVDVPSVVEFARTLPNVVYAEDNLFTCSQDTQEKIKEMIHEHGLNRVVVASCTPRTHEPLFQETLKESGLNPSLFEMVNIRDQCSWVHKDEPDRATEKARYLVRMAVGKSKLLEPLRTVKLNITQKGLIIGGGLAGMVSALSIAEQGFEVVIVEREKELGGNLKNLYYTTEGENVQEYLSSLIERLKNSPRIKVYKGTTIENIEGYVGNYKTTITTKSGKSKKEIKHGIVVVATGSEESKPKEYLYGENERVITQLELEKRIVETENILKVKGRKPASKIQKLKSVVMIQCVGSRDDEHPYCSRVCCQEAIKNALRLRKLNPKTNIYILYRDIRTYGFFEEYYQKAR